MPYEYKLMPSPVSQLTLVARNGKLNAIFKKYHHSELPSLAP